METIARQTVYIVDGCRTPFLKARGKRGPFSAADLAVHACRVLLERQVFEAPDLDEVIAGCMLPSEDEANIGRILGLRLGCGKKVPGWTVQRNCGSGMQALDNAMQDIASGRHHLVLAGGMDAMSHAPLLFNASMVNWLGAWYAARHTIDHLKLIAQFRFHYLAPVIALMRGLTDPIVNLSMGQTAENLAHRFNISREQMDAYAVTSHQRWHQAYEAGYLSEMVPLFDKAGNVYAADDGVRADASIEKLAKLSPFFDKKFGAVTAGNSSQVTDGAAFLILASEKAVKQYQLPVIGKVMDVHWAGLDPAEMGLGPVHAVLPLLQRNALQCKDIDYWEINEAFSAQILACLAAFESKTYCQTHFGMQKAFGSIDRDRLNVDGGAICIGHPIGASGARIVLHLLHVLRRKNAKRGVAALCIGGGQGGAMLVENFVSPL